jgi:hypothetical protein
MSSQTNRSKYFCARSNIDMTADYGNAIASRADRNLLKYQTVHTYNCARVDHNPVGMR